MIYAYVSLKHTKSKPESARTWALDSYSLFGEITDTLSFKENSCIFLRRTVGFFFTQIALKCSPDFIINFIFKLTHWARRLNLFEKTRFLENFCTKLWNLDNTSRSNQVNSCLYKSFRVPRKFHRETSDRVATQSLSRVVNQVLKDTQRSAGQFFF